MRGVELAFGAQNNTIGGTVASARNIISGNSESGVAIFNPGTNGNFVQGNYVGLNAAGTAAPAKGEAPPTGSGTASGPGVIQPKFGGGIFPLNPHILARGNAINAATPAAPAAISNNFGVGIASGAQSNMIGGTAAGAGNVISGNNIDGVLILHAGTNGNMVQGNFIGTNPAGTAAVPNGAGVEVSVGAQNNIIGGAVAGAGNLISGNGGAVTFPNGILMGSPSTNNNRVQGNLIGTQADGVSPLGNSASHGVVFIGSAGSGNNLVGNTIAFSGGAGVFADSGLANTISSNSIFSNSGPGIDLAPLGVTGNDNCDGDAGPNNLQNFPVLTAAASAASTMIQGTLNSAANTTFTLEFFANPACDPSGNGEGKTFIGSMPVTTSGSCTSSFNFTFPIAVPGGQFVTATATDPTGNTSEFSACRQVIQACTFSIAPTAQTFTASGGADMVAVTTPSECGWMAVSNDGFITINSGSSGTGNGTVSYTVAANPTANPRSGTMTIAGQSFTVNQSGMTCAGLISPTSASFSAIGGTGNVMVPAPGGCNWTAVSNDAWLTVTSGSPGMGNGMVGYSVAVNPGGTRIGSLTIAGQTFTVTQTGGLMFYALPTPLRLLETRAGFLGCTTPGAPINANATFTLPARTACSGIPNNAAALTGNITVVPAGAGYLTLYPSNTAQPTVANSNFKVGEITNNLFTVGLAPADGAFKIFASATTEVIIDVTGYYAAPDPGGLFFHPLPTPVRLVETRSNPPTLTGCIKTNAPLSGGVFTVQGRSPVAAPCNVIPESAQVLVGNATTVLPITIGGGGFLTIYPSDTPGPLAASSNFAGNDVINGPFAVKLGADGKFNVALHVVTTDLVIDILGYYSREALDVNGQGLFFNALPSPIRLLETRPDFPGFPLTGCTRTNAPITGNINAATHTQMAANFCGLPAAAQAIVGNVSVVNSTGAGFLTLFPANLTTAPLVATSNYPAPTTFGYNRHFFVGLSRADGKFKVLTQFTTDLILDASGYFAP